MANNATVLTSFNTMKKNSDFILEVVFNLNDLLNGFEEGED